MGRCGLRLRAALFDVSIVWSSGSDMANHCLLQSSKQNDCAHRQAGAAGARNRHVPLVHCGSEHAVHAHLTSARYALLAALR